MQAIEFEATPYQHTIRIPDHIPDGVALRVLLLVDDAATPILTGEQWKALLTAMPDVGQDEDSFPARLKRISKELQERKPDYLTMKVDEIVMPSREDRYER